MRYDTDSPTTGGLFDAFLPPCPICHPPAQSRDGGVADVPPPFTRVQLRRVASCRAGGGHYRLLRLAGDVADGRRSDWHRAPDGMAVNHAALMRTHPRELGDRTLHSWRAQLPAILARYNVRLWDVRGERDGDAPGADERGARDEGSDAA